MFLLCESLTGSFPAAYSKNCSLYSGSNAFNKVVLPVLSKDRLSALAFEVAPCNPPINQQQEIRNRKCVSAYDDGYRTRIERVALRIAVRFLNALSIR